MSSWIARKKIAWGTGNNGSGKGPGGGKGREVEVLNLLSRFVPRETNIEIEEYNCLPIGICKCVHQGIGEREGQKEAGY